MQGETTALQTEITARGTKLSGEEKAAIKNAIDAKEARITELQGETTALQTEITARGTKLSGEEKAAIKNAIDAKEARITELQGETTALQTELTARGTDMNTWKTEDIQRAKDTKEDRIVQLQAETTALQTELGTRGEDMSTAEKANIRAAIDTKTKRVGELQAETRALETELTHRETSESLSVNERIQTVNRLFDARAAKMKLAQEDGDALEKELVQNEKDREAAVQQIRDDERQKNIDRMAADKQTLADFNRARVTDAENALAAILADEKSSGRERRDAVNALYDAKAKAIQDTVDDEKEQTQRLKELDKTRERHLKDTMSDMERAQRDYFQSVKDMAAEAFKFQVDLMIETHKAERQAGRDRLNYQAQFQTDWDTIVGDYEARITAVREQAAPIIAAEADKTKRNALIAERDEVIKGLETDRTADLQEITDRLNESEFDFYANMREIRHKAVQKRNKAFWEIGGQLVGQGVGIGVSILSGGAIPPEIASKLGGDFGKFAGSAIGDWRAEDAEDKFLKAEIQRWQKWEANRQANERKNIRTTADLDEALVGTSFDPAVIAQKQLDALEAIQERAETLRREKIDDLQWEIENTQYGLETMLADESTTVEALKKEHRELWDHKRALRVLEAKDLEDRNRILIRAARERIAERDKMLDDFADRHKKDADARTEDVEDAPTFTEETPTGSVPPREDVLDDLQWEVDRTRHFLNQKLADEEAQLDDVLGLHKAHWDARLALAKARERDTDKHERLETRHGWDFSSDLARLTGQRRWTSPADTPAAPETETEVPTGETREERAARIGELRWEVEEAKHYLDEAKKDASKTKGELLGLFTEYWDARKALAEGTLDAETQATALERELTRLGWQRSAAQTQLLSRFVDEVEDATTEVSTTLADTVSDALTTTTEQAEKTTAAITDATQQTGLNITHIVSAVNAALASVSEEGTGISLDTLSTLLTAMQTTTEAGTTAVTQGIDSQVAAAETGGLNITDVVGAVNAALASVAASGTAAVEAGVDSQVTATQAGETAMQEASTTTAGVVSGNVNAQVAATAIGTTAMQHAFQNLFSGAGVDVAAFWKFHNQSLGLSSLIVEHVLEGMKTGWTVYYGDLKTETTAFWGAHNQSYGFGSLVVDTALTSMKETWQGFYDELRTMADSAGTHVSGVLDSLDSQIADTARSLARLQDEQRNTPQRVSRRRVRRRELFHSDVNDAIAAAGGARVASVVANRASATAVQRQNAEDFTHFFGEGFMRKLQEAGITPEGGHRRGGTEQTTTVVSPIILQLDDGTLKKITERTLVLEDEGVIARSTR